MGQFYNKLKETMRGGGGQKLAKTAYDNIVNRMFMKNLPPICDDLDDNSEVAIKLMEKKLIAGNIYIFQYRAKKAVTITHGEDVINITDSMPVVFVTEIMDDMIRGINLNYCNLALRILLLDLITTFDEPFFFLDGANLMIVDKKPPVSTQLSIILNLPNRSGEKLITSRINAKFDNFNSDFIFRNYSTKNISLIKYLPHTLWPDVVFLYPPSNNVATDGIKKFQDLTGISTVKL